MDLITVCEPTVRRPNEEGHWGAVKRPMRLSLLLELQVQTTLVRAAQTALLAQAYLVKHVRRKSSSKKNYGKAILE